MAAQAAAILVQADLLPTLGTSIWDTSALVADDGILGRVLHALIGYTARPYGIQVLAYIATLGGIFALMKFINRIGRARPRQQTMLPARTTPQASN